MNKSKREQFIELVDLLMEDAVVDKDEWTDALVYFEALKMQKDKEKPVITNKGAEILLYIQNNYQNYKNMFSAKVIAEGMGVVTRSVSASMRGLVTGGFLEKISDKPVIYSITEAGKNFDLSKE